MKKTLLLSTLALAAISANAQQAIEQPSLCDNWSIGVNGGVTTPLVNHPFFGSMRGVFGLNLNKQVTPTLGLGVEGLATVNTSSWGGPHSATAFDASYVGPYAKVDLMNLFGGYQCGMRPFTIDALVGVGWGHHYFNKGVAKDNNFAATKAGLNFNFNVSPNVEITLQPAIYWNMSDGQASQASAAYDARRATFNFTAGVTYRMGGEQFNCVMPMDPIVIDALNAQINALHAEVDAANANADSWQAQAIALNQQLQACQAQPQIVETQVTEVNNYLNTVRYVFFKIGSSVITNDQMPNVEMIAAYMNSHPDATLLVKGYASKDGPEELNIKLAKARAESVKNALVNKYGINECRIKAEGQGIGNMFDEESWNRVSICILQTDAD